MQLFFEEDGTHKVGLILKRDGGAYQVELPSGKRTKVKGGHVLFEFEYAAGDFLAAAKKAASEIDPAFLWEVASGEEVDYTTLAAEYFGTPSALEKAATFLALHENPVYFYKKGRGVFKPAPKETLERALEAIERRKKLEEKKKAMVSEMLEGKVPAEIQSEAYALLLKPDKNSIEWKALNDAASVARLTPLNLLLKLGAIASPYVWHTESFYFENFPQGRNFPRSLGEPGEFPENLPEAHVKAFSIDDSSTTEIDDAASITPWGEGKLRLGVHIAAPSLLIPRDSPVDKVARERMSTVYGPGIKTTMLPEAWINKATLIEGKSVPCVSLYAVLDSETMAVLSTETLVERVTVADNLRYDTFEDEVTEEAMKEGTLTIPYAAEMALLWRFAKMRQKVREEVRGRPEQPMRKEWYFVLEGEGEAARAAVRCRMRGAPIDLIVSEMMIFANETWGLWLEEHGYAGIYRSQRMGRVKMSVTPGPHDGLGVTRYAWSTSPLRRYVDLVNQREIIAAALGKTPVYEAKDTDLYTTVTAFEGVYEAYNDFQRRMERYWSLRWIEQEGKTEITAIVLKDELVRIEGLPMMQRIPGLPELERGRRIRLQILGCDYIELLLETKLLEVLDEAESFEEEEEEVELIEATEERKEEPLSEEAKEPSGEEGENRPSEENEVKGNAS